MNCVYLILALLASPAIAPDYTNPRKTMETFIEALEADDRPAMKNCIVSPRDQFNALDVVIEEATADRRLWLACQKLTPDIRAAIHVEMLAHYCSDDSLATSRKLIKEATVDVTDKMAVLNFKPREGNESLIAVMSEAAHSISDELVTTGKSTATCCLLSWNSSGITILPPRNYPSWTRSTRIQ